MVVGTGSAFGHVTMHHGLHGHLGLYSTLSSCVPTSCIVEQASQWWFTHCWVQSDWSEVDSIQFPHRRHGWFSLSLFLVCFWAVLLQPQVLVIIHSVVLVLHDPDSHIAVVYNYSGCIQNAPARNSLPAVLKQASLGEISENPWGFKLQYKPIQTQIAGFRR